MAPASILFDIGWQPTLVTSSAFLIVSVLMTCLNKTLQAFILEFLKFGGGKQFTGDLEKLVENQYKKDKDECYKIKISFAEVLVLPPKYVDAVKNLPDSQITFLGAVQDMLEKPYTRSAEDLDIINVSVRNDFTKHFVTIMNDIHVETNYAMSTELPEFNKEWTPWVPHHHVLRIIGLISGRVFIGPALNRTNEYLDSTVGYSISALQATDFLLKYPKILRPIIQYFVPALYEAEKHRATLKRVLKPVLEQRLAAEAAGEKPVADLLTWNHHNSARQNRASLESAVTQQMTASQAAIHTTSMQLTNTIYNLAGRPEYLKPLREEIEEVLAGEPDGILTRNGMSKLKKLDSFMKEVQRLSPPSCVSYFRKVHKPLTLPNGLVLKKNSHLSVAVREVGRDPDNFENPREFDGFRFEKLRQQPGYENSYQFASTSNDSLVFGHGSHACPGRFFAGYEVKSVMVYLIRNFDIKLPDGVKTPELTVFAQHLLPSQTQEILLKKIR